MKTRLTKRERLTRRRTNHAGAAFRYRLQRETWKRQAKRLKFENAELKEALAKWIALAEANAKGWESCQKRTERQDRLLLDALDSPALPDNSK